MFIFRTKERTFDQKNPSMIWASTVVIYNIQLQAETYKTGSDSFNNLNIREFRKYGHQTPT